jgi:hypothetical protein
VCAFRLRSVHLRSGEASGRGGGRCLPDAAAISTIRRETKPRCRPELTAARHTAAIQFQVAVAAEITFQRRHAVTAGTSYHQDDVNAREELSIAEVFETRPRRASATSCRSLTGDGAWRSRIRSLSNCGSTRLRQAEEPLGLGIRHGAANFVYGREDHEPLLPRNGVRPKVASERPEHSRVTFDLNSHLLPGMQEDAASRVDEPYG